MRLEDAESLEALQDGWSELAQRTGNVFATPEWLGTWWRHFGGGRRLFAARRRDEDGRVAALFALYLWRSAPFKIIRFVGHGPSDQLGPIHGPEHRAAAADGLRELLGRARWHLFIGDQLPADEHWENDVGGRVLGTVGNPVMRLDGLSWDEFLASRSSKLRGRIGNYERRLARDYRLSYRLADDGERLQGDLDVLFWLHGARWSGQRSSFGGPTEAFHRDFAELALREGWLRLWFLELDGKAVAAWYGLRYAGTDSYYQAGRDPAFDRQSVGFVMLMHSMREAMNDGMREYRFLRGGESYKYRFATEDPGLATIAVGRGPLGAAAFELAKRLRARRAGSGVADDGDG